MFEAMRRMIVPIIIIVLIFFVGLIVVEWGLDLSGRSQYGNPNLAGMINGEEISYPAFNQYYRQLYQAELDSSDADVSDSRIQQLEDQAWGQLVVDRLILQEAENHRIVVTNKDVYEYLKLQPPVYLQNSPSFQTDGIFDYQKYLGAMADPQATSFWNSIEPIVRADLTKIMMQQRIIQTVVVTDAEIQQDFIDSLETVNAGSVNVASRQYSRTPPAFTDDEQRFYFEEHRDEYTLEERVVLKFVSIEIAPTEFDWEIIEARAKKIYDSAIAGADFEELARLHSDDPGSSTNGGDLGWFTTGRMVKEFDSVAFTMEQGEISAPLRTEFGYHILKHFGYRTDEEIPPGKTEKEKVKKARVSHVLVGIEPTAETLDRWNRRLENFALNASNSSFDEAAEKAGLSVLTTVPFVRGSRIREMGGGLPEAQKFAFSVKPNDISGVIDDGRSMFIVQLIERIAPGLASFEEVQARVKQDLIRITIIQMCSDTAQAIYSDVQSGLSLIDAAEKHNVAYQELTNIRRGSYLVGVGRSPEAIGALFALPEKGMISAPTEYGSGSVLFELLEQSSPDLTSFTEKRDSVAQSVLFARQREVYNRWYQEVFNNSEIENYVALQREQ